MNLVSSFKVIPWAWARWRAVVTITEPTWFKAPGVRSSENTTAHFVEADGDTPEEAIKTLREKLGEIVLFSMTQK